MGCAGSSAVMWIALVLLGGLACGGARAQFPGAIAPESSPFNDQRILGVLPDFQTVRDPNALVAPLTVKQKWSLA